MSASSNLRAKSAALNELMRANDREFETYWTAFEENRAEQKRREKKAAASSRIRNWKKENVLPAGARIGSDSDSDAFSSPRGTASDYASDTENAEDGFDGEDGADGEAREDALLTKIPHHANNVDAFKAYVQADVDREAKWRSVSDWARRDAVEAIKENEADRAPMMRQFALFKARATAILGKRDGADGNCEEDDSGDQRAAKRRRVKAELAAESPERRHHANMGSPAEAALQTNSVFTATNADSTAYEENGFDEDPVDDEKTDADTVAVYDMTEFYQFYAQKDHGVHPALAGLL